MPYYPPVVVSPRAQSRGSRAVTNPSFPTVPSPMIFQPQIQSQHVPTTTTAPVPILTGARSSAQPMAYVQQPLQVTQSLPMYAQQPQLAGHPSSSYTSGYSYGYGTPSSTHYAPGSVGGPYIFVQDRTPSPRRYPHYRGHRNRHGRRSSSHRRYRTYSDPEYDNRHRGY